MTKKILALVLLTIGLTACFPVYDTNYQFIQPSSQEGIQFVNNCAKIQKAYCGSYPEEFSEECLWWSVLIYADA